MKTLKKAAANKNIKIPAVGVGGKIKSEQIIKY